MIFERTGTIGLLKALGASDTGIRKIFLLIASKVVLKGMLIGNAAGIGFVGGLSLFFGLGFGRGFSLFFGLGFGNGFSLFFRFCFWLHHILFFS